MPLTSTMMTTRPIHAFSQLPILCLPPKYGGGCIPISSTNYITIKTSVLPSRQFAKHIVPNALKMIEIASLTRSINDLTRRRKYFVFGKKRKEIAYTTQNSRKRRLTTLSHASYHPGSLCHHQKIPSKKHPIIRKRTINLTSQTPPQSP